MREMAYLKKGRLADVLALIQILGLYTFAHRSDNGLVRESQAQPRSAKRWEQVAREHPEFFRVIKNKEESISLISRHSQAKDGGEGYSKLSLELVTKLMETAIKMHDSQLNSSRWWTFWLPVVGAFIGALAARFIPIR